ncbi:MAG TPA: copper resistance protein NlpE [Methylomicrobium sp.]|nr:copper resistance protein NlpE [Methylomicrobium sp.]
MRTLKKQLRQNLVLFIFSSLLSAIPAMAAQTDIEAQESFAKARSKSQMKGQDHSAHQKQADPSEEFHGIFYGYLPCSDCAGIKTTLSLKQKNSYLLVTQPARESSREYYERGKYDWNEENRTVILTPTKGGTKIRRFRIEDAGTLIQLNEDGSRITGDEDSYTLRSSDTYKSREVHIH